MLGTKAAGLEEVAKAERVLLRKSYDRRPPRLGPSELDLSAAAALYMEQQGFGAKTKRRVMMQLKEAIARGYLNAPFTTGGNR